MLIIRNKQNSHACGYAQPTFPGGGSIRDFGGSQNIHRVGIGCAVVAEVAQAISSQQRSKAKQRVFGGFTHE